MPEAAAPYNLDWNRYLQAIVAMDILLLVGQTLDERKNGRMFVSGNARYYVYRLANCCAPFSMRPGS